MSLKEIWKDKVDDVDDILAEDINDIANQAIQNTDDIAALNKNFKEEKENTSANFDEVNAEIDSLNADVEGLNTKTDASNEEIETLKERADGFDNAIDDLNSRADNLSADLTTNFNDLNAKVDGETERVNEELSQKADITYVDEGINEKATEVTKIVNNSFSNALKGEVSGTVVRVDDVSPVEHKLDIKVKSDNILPITYDWTEKELNGTTFTACEDKSINVSGTPSVLTNIVLCQFDATAYIGKNLVIPLSPGGLILYVHLYYSDGTATTWNWMRGDRILSNTVPKNARTIEVGISVQTSFDGNKVTLYPQMNVGTELKGYSPYVAPDTVTVARYGKNLIPYPFSDTTVERNGITFTDNGDGSLTLSGTATADTWFNLIMNNKKRILMPKGQPFRLSGGITLDSNAARVFVGYDNGTPNTQGTVTYVYDSGTSGGTTVTPQENSYLHSIGITIKAGFTFNNVVIKPQLELGDTTTEFEMYKDEEKAVAKEDGSLFINSVSPSVTLLPDKAGVTLEAEYNRDTNKVIESLINAIISLGGNI